MQARYLVIPFALAILVGMTPYKVKAESAWQKPEVKQCDMGPGDECNLEVTCPADKPYVSSGGGGMPSAEPKVNSVGITMNLPVSENTWRVRWKNLSPDQSAQAKVAVRVKCSDDAAEAGWK